MSRFSFAKAALLTTLWALAGCGQGSSGSPQSSVLRVSVLPDEDPAALAEVHTPLIAYLSSVLDVQMELEIFPDYGSLVDAFDAGHVDLAWFGGLTFVQAEARTGAFPVAMRDVDLRFTSVFLVPASTEATMVEDLRGSRFAFGSDLSTSGHLMPRYFLEHRGIVPETFFTEVLYSGAHDLSLLLVQEGSVDVAVSNATIVRRMFAEGGADPAVVRVLEETPEYRDYVWAVHPSVPADVREGLLDALLALDMGNADHAAILARQGAESYVPATSRDFDALRSIARQRGLLGGGSRP